ncbi:myosin-binding protein 3 isoform X1 [Gossypium arboreum]|uniref:myosin-binding protein 3 isoform X1 n=1 Tax=Gossypium arboreum TaxID=29729 RepID=UPI000818F53F|nr:myosin-binding protein 3 isoform X1 [Gossypium arboreum]
MAAGNKFARFLHKHTSKITVILVYAVLEWILIFLLLLNSFFTYLITKFANYFGLKPPCPWCSRVDHVLEPNNNNSSNSYRDLVCDKHGSEISKLSYCSSHGKLAETHLMCEECLASRPTPSDGKSIGMARRIAFISWVSGDPKLDNGEKVVPCSCCNGTKLHPPYFLFKPSWGALDCAEKGSLIIQAIEDDDDNDGSESDQCKDGEDMIEIKLNNQDDDDDDDDQNDQRAKTEHQVLFEKDVHEDDRSDAINIAEKHFSSATSGIVEPCFAGDYMLDFINLHHQKCVSDRLFPVELIDLSTSASHFSEKQDNGSETSDSSNEETPLHAIDEIAETITCPREAENLELDHQLEKNDLNLMAERPISETKLLSTQDSDLPLVQVSDPSLQCLREDGFSTFKDQAKGVDGPESSKTQILGFTLGTHEEKSTMDENGERTNASLSVHTDCNNNEAEEEKFPDTPTSSHQGMHYLHNKLLFFEKRESGIEVSLDRSVVTAMESGDPVRTIERLKTSLKAERKALSALYAELEEERSASAIAANQTMAMITRLQEEKAAMQMEALQYQRMMEEQSEYDQEALQLLNELMIKREKEKEELEKELEVYRKKVLYYEAKEKTRIMRISKDGSLGSGKSSAACSYAEDSDELSIDLNREAKDEDSSFSGNQESSSDAVGNLEEMALDCVNHVSALDESLTEFEEERLSILDQLKALEDKLLTMGDDQFMEDLKSIQNSFDGLDEKNDLRSKEGNEFSKETSCGKTMASMAKSLLPFLDAADNGTEEGTMYGKQGESDSEPVVMQTYPGPELELDPKKLAIEEEVDHVYERLQALEEDKEFLKNCMSSIKKGDKGMDLLQEILQHLRDLRAVELRTRTLCGDVQG